MLSRFRKATIRLASNVGGGSGRKYSVVRRLLRPFSRRFEIKSEEEEEGFRFEEALALMARVVAKTEATSAGDGET